MTRDDLILCILTAAQGQTLTPVQIQKAAFLVTENLPNLVTSGPRFRFEPYDYGPFDRSVYLSAEGLRVNGLCEINRDPTGRWNHYSSTDEGLREGSAIIDKLPSEHAKYLNEVVAWVRKQSFSSLVKSVYDAYPEMRANSIFRD